MTSLIASHNTNSHIYDNVPSWIWSWNCQEFASALCWCW